MLIQIKDTILNNFSVINDSQELTRHLQHALNNDLEYSSDEVRVLGRDMAGGGTYTAILHKENNDWVKDLTVPFKGEGSYLKHDATEDDINFRDEAHSGLWNIWDIGTGSNSATAYHAIDEGNNTKDDTWDTLMGWISKGNDHIVVGEPYEEPTVIYTVEPAKKVEEIMDWHENDTFNEEMVMVEDATEVWHNSEEPYIEMRMQDGELTAVPTEEYTSPENLYNN